MKITQLPIKGAYLIEIQEIKVERGLLDINFIKKNLKSLVSILTLNNVIYLKITKWVFYPEIKMVSFFKGVVYDVLLDIGKESSTYLKWVSTESREDNNKILYIPSGVAHGFQVLKNNSTVYYQLNAFLMLRCYLGVLRNDPAFKIEWHYVKKNY